MIYRILSDDGQYVKVREPIGPDDWDAWQWRPSGANFGGVDRAGPDWGGMPAPSKLRNRRARFWFTEDGWHRYGRHIYQFALDRGNQVKVIRQKNPEESQVVYRDRWQVAILPPPRR